MLLQFLRGLNETTDEQTFGVKIVKRAVEEPLRQISLTQVLKVQLLLMKFLVKRNNFGYNARDNKYEDLVSAGIIDPTKVVRSALQNAASVAGLNAND